tara:strand:+ start:252 stop:797 length:546 start_codon:yes stop_codon:yes gene_type:complete
MVEVCTNIQRQEIPPELIGATIAGAIAVALWFADKWYERGQSSKRRREQQSKYSLHFDLSIKDIRRQAASLDVQLSNVSQLIENFDDAPQVRSNIEKLISSICAAKISLPPGFLPTFEEMDLLSSQNIERVFELQHKTRILNSYIDEISATATDKDELSSALMQILELSQSIQRSVEDTLE